MFLKNPTPPGFCTLESRRASTHLLLALGVLGFVLPSLALRAQAPACGDTIATDTTFTADIVCPPGFTGVALTIAADGITVDGNGFRIVMDSGGTAMSAADISDITIRNVVASTTAGGGQGIFLTGVRRATVESNDVSGRQRGISSLGGTDNVFSGNTARDIIPAPGEEWAVRFGAEENVTFVGNDLSGAFNGLVLQDMNGFSLIPGDSNDFSGIPGTAVQSTGGSELTIEDMDLSGSGGGGVIVWGTIGTSIRNNLVTGRTRGISIVGGSDHLIDGNDARNTVPGPQEDFAIRIADTDDVILTNNDLSGAYIGLVVSNIDNFTLTPATNNNLSGIFEIALWILGGTNVTVEDMDLSAGGLGAGIVLSSTTQATIRGNDLRGRQRGISSTLGANTVIDDNDIRHTVTASGEDFAIRLDREVNPVVTYNDLSSGAAGMLLVNIEDFTLDPLSGNDFSALANALTIVNGNLITVEYMNFSGAGGSGLAMTNTRDSTIRNNIIRGRQYGISSIGGADNVFTGNDLTDSIAGPGPEYAVRLIGEINPTFTNNDLSGTTGAAGGGLVLNAMDGFLLSPASGNNLTAIGGTAVEITNSSNVTVENMDLSGSGGFGIVMLAVSKTTLRNNDVSGRQRGISATGGTDNVIHGNNASGSPAGPGEEFAIKLAAESNVTLTDNDLSGGWVGLFLQNMVGFSLSAASGNSFSNLAGTALSIQGGSQITVEGLNLSTSGGTGLLMTGTSDVLMNNLEIEGRQEGVRIVGAVDTTSTCSRFATNATGVLVSQSSGAVFVDNTFEGNGLGIYNGAAEAVVFAENNYWGTPDGPSTLGGSGDGFVGNVDAEPFRTAPPPCGSAVLYAADDLGNRDTQIFTIDLVDGHDASIGGVHPLADLETLILDPATKDLYGITAETGELWQIDKTSGALTLVCTIDTVRKFREIASSSFHPTTGELWVYQWNKGLRTVDLSTCEMTQQWNHPRMAGVARKWDAIAWAPDGSKVYGTQRADLYVWDPITEVETVICSNLPDKTEGLEYARDGRLLSSSGSKIYELLPDTCTVVELFDFPDREDIESLSFE